VSCAETVEPIDLPFGLWTPVGQSKHEFSRIRQVAAVFHMVGHIGATWRIRLKGPSAAAMWSYFELV